MTNIIRDAIWVLEVSVTNLIKAWDFIIVLTDYPRCVFDNSSSGKEISDIIDFSVFRFEILGAQLTQILWVMAHIIRNSLQDRTVKSANFKMFNQWC